MGIRRWVGFGMLFALLFGMAGATGNEVEPTPENPESYVEFDDESTAAPKLYAAITGYTLTVDLANQVVSAYSVSGGKETLVRQMTCSTGKDSTPTPTGTFTISDQHRWGYFTKFDCWAQYWSRFNGPYLFHSVLYNKKDEATLVKSSVSNLGSKASHGCVRLNVVDAGWIFNNCPSGTKVSVIRGTRDSKYNAAVRDAGRLVAPNLYVPGAAEPSIGTGTVRTSGGSLNLRASMSTSARVVRTLPNRAVVTVHSVSGGWARVSYQGDTGYVSMDYLDFAGGGTTPAPTKTPAGTPAPTPIPGGAVGRVRVATNGSALNLRSRPSTSSSVLASIPRGTVLDVLAFEDSWVRVNYNGKVGYASSTYLVAL